MAPAHQAAAVRRIRRLSSRLATLQFAYSLFIFFCVFLFAVELTVIHQSEVIVGPIRAHPQLELFPRRQPYRLSAREQLRYIQLICTVLLAFFAFYAITMSYLVGYRGSLTTSIIHSALSVSYLMISLGQTPPTLLPLSLLDKILITIQLALGITFVTWKRNIHMLRASIKGRPFSFFDFHHVVPGSRLSNEQPNEEEDELFTDEAQDLIHEIDMFCYLIP